MTDPLTKNVSDAAIQRCIEWLAVPDPHRDEGCLDCDMRAALQQLMRLRTAAAEVAAKYRSDGHEWLTLCVGANPLETAIKELIAAVESPAEPSGEPAA